MVCHQWTSFSVVLIQFNLIIAAKTLITANPGCFLWISQANNYSPNRKCPSDSPPSESSWACDSPLFSSLQPQLRESVLQWVSKTRVSAPPPPGELTFSWLTVHRRPTLSWTSFPVVPFTYIKEGAVLANTTRPEQSHISLSNGCWRSCRIKTSQLSFNMSDIT